MELESIVLIDGDFYLVKNLPGNGNYMAIFNASCLLTKSRSCFVIFKSRYGVSRQTSAQTTYNGYFMELYIGVK